MQPSELPGHVELVHHSHSPGLKGLGSLLRDDDAIGRAAKATHNTLEAENVRAAAGCSTVNNTQHCCEQNGSVTTEPTIISSCE